MLAHVAFIVVVAKWQESRSGYLRAVCFFNHSLRNYLASAHPMPGTAVCKLEGQIWHLPWFEFRAEHH